LGGTLRDYFVLVVELLEDMGAGTTAIDARNGNNSLFAVVGTCFQGEDASGGTTEI
jgi:hypothetical protein